VGTVRLLETTGITFTYEEGTRALEEVSFFAEEGEFVGLLASNGGGKTTLLKVLLGLLRPQEGEVLYRGKSIKKIPPRELYGKVGLVFQNPDDQLFATTVAEDVAFGPRNLRLPEEEVKRRVEEALDQVEARELRGRAIHHLSFGEKKRVCLAGVLAMKPEVMILDEPVAGLDPAGEARMMQLLGKLNKDDGLTLVMATHSIDLIPLFLDRLYILNQGRVVKSGTPLEIFSDRKMIHEARLRLPYITSLIEELKHRDKIRIDGFPLTLGEARIHLLELLQQEKEGEPSADTAGCSRGS
jgi:cobalt/nickel transport system ATP-binding protein